MRSNGSAGAEGFAPILTSFTARVAGLEPSALLSSPATLARATVETQRLVGHQVVLCAYDPELLCRACCASAGETVTPAALVAAGPDRACSTEPISVLLDALPQIRAGLPDGVRLLLTVTGPAALHAQLVERCDVPGGTELETYVAGTFVALANGAFAAGADGLALIERFGPDVPPRIARSHRTLRKLADFHEALLVAFCTEGAAPEDGFDQIFDLAAADGPLVAARCADGERSWVCTREDVARDIDVADVQALAGQAA